MQTLNQIFSAFKLAKSDVKRLSNEAKEDSIDCGKAGITKKLPSGTWDLFYEMADKVWYSTNPISHKIELGFQLYEVFPNYYHFLTPLYHSIRNNEIEDASDKDNIWKHFMHYLARENYYADPVGYGLWVDFFEDQSTVQETWNGLMKFYDKKAMIRLLEQTGPVPYPLKQQAYRILLKDPESHNAIFLSLLFSAHDLYGQLNKENAKEILKQLKIDRSTDDYKLLVNKL